MTSFDELGLSKKALDAVKRMGYAEPTPVQARSIPVVLAGRDVIAAAKTGTGKTGAFALPAMDRLGHPKGNAGPLMLVVTPTRELAQQIGEVCAQIANSTHHRIVTVVGGLSYGPQIAKLKHGCDILIATPGRLIDLMDQKAVRLNGIHVLVLDEADRMLDMGFLPSVRKIVAACPRDRQTLLFSATIDGSVRKQVGTLLRDPAVVEVAHKGDVADTIDQYIIRTPHLVKPALLKALLANKGAERVIVFARTRSRAESTARRLRRAGYDVEAIHSDRTQSQRRRALDKFASGEVNILTATDVLARGIDVEEVDYVVNYDLPTQPEDYVHRIGRTGRAGARGFAVSFVTPETEAALKDIERLTKQEIPPLDLEFDFETAEKEAVQKAQGARAHRDPEIAQAKRELREREKRKAARAEASGHTPGSSRQSASAGKKKRKVRQTKPVAPSKKAHSEAQHRSHGRSAAPKLDLRPGRAHRAAVNRQRGNRRNSRP